MCAFVPFTLFSSQIRVVLLNATLDYVVPAFKISSISHFYSVPLLYMTVRCENYALTDATLCSHKNGPRKLCLEGQYVRYKSIYVYKSGYYYVKGKRQHHQ